MPSLSQLDSSQALEIIEAIASVVMVSLAGLALAGAAIWKVRPVDSLAGGLLAAAGLMQPPAFVLVLPLGFRSVRSQLAVFGAEDSALQWIGILPSCRALVVLSLAVLLVDALVVSSALRLARRRNIENS